MKSADDDAARLLTKYGQHGPNCSTVRALPFERRSGAVECTCGFDAAVAFLAEQPDATERPYPNLLSREEAHELLTYAECLWHDLQGNNLGGFSGINRPFYILHEFERVIEKFGRRDVGLHWSQDQLDATAPKARLDAEQLAAFMWRKKFEMEHVRRFTVDMQPGLNPYRNSLCQIEGDLEEYLVEAGYDRKWFAAYDPETQEDR